MSMRRYLAVTPQARAGRAPSRRPATVAARRSPLPPIGKPTNPTLERIRASARGIAGYACRFNTRGLRAGGVWEIVLPGAFAASLAAARLELRLHHDDLGALASMPAGSLYAREDAGGLWIEAMLPATADGNQVLAAIDRAGAVALSVGSERSLGNVVQGVQVLHTIDAFEISLVLPPRQPGRAGTWAMRNADAQRAWMRELRASVRR